MGLILVLKQTVGYVLDKAHFVVPESTDGCVKLTIPLPLNYTCKVQNALFSITLMSQFVHSSA